MKVFFKYSLAALVALTYIVSMVGVAVYHCHCAHSNQIVWLADGDCECAHEHHHHGGGECHSGSCCAAKVMDDDKVDISDHCCTVVVESLHTDQDLPTTLSKIVTDFYSIFSLCQPLTVVLYDSPVAALAHYESPPPLQYVQHSLLARMAQWRL